MSSTSTSTNTKGRTVGAGRAIALTIVYIVIYVIVSAITKYIIESLLPSFHIFAVKYEVYVQILLALAFGYLIVNGFSSIFYYSLLSKYGHPTAAAIRNVVRIIGIGALAASIAGAVAGGAAGVALGGFIGIVIGFATQQVLGQAVSGLFLLIARPFKINDNVNIVGEDGIVEDVATLFTTVVKADGTKVLVPNNLIIGNKIYLKQQQKS
ncbi:small-conductance mechanosensitive channel [Caldisphaera lagunensis DSM 15908]|uniref:Small-conductance mechanosensitive channel n=1 Tax=Caldisphaera lagunensis (strain DSM 15908 / JCM 11604 / ANMR 0165 / IC-154) TaxID=1056495 RepID=L0A9P9_CALLD|nr:mechanosensitive ion channel domain-containing protein [Caldisphaera lagunensis]AFZ69872.1 small-conductance mechanosensitive channel [Caldisphaera lagunensis DSM 15908]